MTSSRSMYRVSSNARLCQTCRQFIQALSEFYHHDRYPAKGWEADEKASKLDTGRGVAFRHHLSFEALASSGASSCELCHVLHVDFASLDPELRRGWLALYPLQHEYVKGENRNNGYFRAGFSDSLFRMDWNDSMRAEDYPSHMFRIGRFHERVDGTGGDDEQGPKNETIAVPPRPTPEYIARRYGDWVAMCQNDPGHEACRGGSNASSSTEASSNSHNGNQNHPHTSLQQLPLDSGELPTRVVDLGPPHSTDPPRLYTSTPGEKAPYIALSHCWGGAIPSSTVTSNLATRIKHGLPLDQLPRNFLDALAVTRALGLRYLWIDSLCIIQDSPSDWSVEAGKMALVYAGAAVVVSALEARASTVGFLHPVSGARTSRGDWCGVPGITTPKGASPRGTPPTTGAARLWRRR
ncbi:hypothetical protein PG984_016269 [Apiospora sp. TS-2023a]